MNNKCLHNIVRLTIEPDVQTKEDEIIKTKKKKKAKQK